MRLLSGTRALVTGGTSGLGLAMAHALAGAEWILTDVRASCRE
jgi:NAD(P)-dependent dehydrogenase (short-subunit alcohol dehydrogenase family)